MFESEEIPLATHRVQPLKQINWDQLLVNPALLPKTITHGTKSPQTSTIEGSKKVTIFIPRSVGKDGLKKIKTELKPDKFTGSVETKVEIEDTQGNVKKVKGTFWTTPQTINTYAKG